jgi:hypothetical protein
MSNLNHYVRQLRPRTESYTPHVDKIQNILTETSFGPDNFPNGVGGDKPQSGTRTIYPPVAGEDYAYPEGFPTLKQTDLVDKNGEVIKTISTNTTVWFVAPATLHKLIGSSWFAKVSLKAYDKPFDGYIMISHVEKPGGKSQKRVAAGTKTQEECAAFIKELCLKEGIEFKSEFSVAPSGSTKPDLVMTIGGKRIQFEIKGTNARKNEITFFDITARRKQNAKSKAGKVELDKTSELYINSVSELKNVFKKQGNTWDKIRKKSGDEGGAFHAIMEYYKSLDPTIGYAGDSEVVKSGKLPSVFKAVSGGLLKNIHNSILQHFTKGGDDYFVIHDRSSDTFEVYNVNKENDILKMPTLPQFKEFRLSTYGGPSAAGTRVGYKIKL